MAVHRTFPLLLLYSYHPALRHPIQIHLTAVFFLFQQTVHLQTIPRLHNWNILLSADILYPFPYTFCLLNIQIYLVDSNLLYRNRMHLFLSYDHNKLIPLYFFSGFLLHFYSRRSQTYSIRSLPVYLFAFESMNNMSLIQTPDIPRNVYLSMHHQKTMKNFHPSLRVDLY